MYRELDFYTTEQLVALRKELGTFLDTQTPDTLQQVSAFNSSPDSASIKALILGAIQQTAKESLPSKG